MTAKKETSITLPDGTEFRGDIKITPADFEDRDCTIEGQLSAVVWRTREGLMQVTAHTSEILNQPTVSGEEVETFEEARSSCVKAIVEEMRKIASALNEYEEKTTAIEVIVDGNEG